MDVREKLVEQLREVASKTPPICRYDNPDEIEHFGKIITVYCKPFEQFQELMRDAADYIAHGVTVQEWVSVNDRLPEQADPATAVLGITKQGKCYVVYYYKAAINDEFTGFYDNAVKRDVTHWMPLPNPPKGE